MKPVLIIVFASLSMLTAIATAMERTVCRLKQNYTLSQLAAVGVIDNEPPKQIEIFGPRVLSVGNVFRGTFTPDGRTFYFFKNVTKDQEDYRIFMSQLIKGGWTEPRRVVLGDEHSDLYPSISSDGQRMIFSSYRPAPGNTSSKHNANLWYVDRRGDGWGQPVFISGVNKLGYYHSWPEFGTGGEIYFRRTSPDWQTSETLRARWNGVEYTKPELFQAVEQWKDWRSDLHIVGGLPSPDGKAIFLDVVKIDPQTKQRSKSDIWVSLKNNNKWTEPKPLGLSINTDTWETFPFFSPDGKVLYFVRGFNTFYRVSLKEALRTVK